MSLGHLWTMLAFQTDRLTNVRVPTPAEADAETAKMKQELVRAAAQWMRVYVSGAAQEGRDSFKCPPDWKWDGDAIDIWKGAASILHEEMRAAGWRHFYADGHPDKTVCLYWAR